MGAPIPLNLAAALEIEIDARLVSFARTETERLRWGANLRRTFGGIAPDDAGADDFEAEEDESGWRLNANFTHSVQLANRRLARTGLPEQDLLDGGAGTGNGQSRHTLQSRIGLSHQGIGMQLRANWKSRARITAGTTEDPNRIVFSPLLRVDVSAFANLDSVFEGSPWAEGARLSLIHVEDLANAVAALLAEGCVGLIAEVDDGRGGYGWREMIRTAADAFGRRARVMRVPLAIPYGLGLLNQMLGQAAGYTPMLTPGKAREIYHHDWTCDCGPIMARTDWRPAVSLRDGFAATIAWYRQQGWL